MITTEAIWQAYQQRLRAFILQRLDRQQVDDLLQEVFIKIHQSIGKLQEADKLEPWLFQLTRNTIIDHYRRQAAKAYPAWLDDSPDHQAELRRELSACLEPMIAALPDNYRDVLWLCELAGQSQEQVAKQQGLSLAATKSRVRRGRQLLKQQLLDCCDVELNQQQQMIDFERKSRDCGQC